jgi:hypothetical protein
MNSENDTDGGSGAGQARARQSPMRTLRSVVGFLVFFTLVAFTIAMISTAPWMRVSPDCSVVCVFLQDLKDFF